MQGGTARRLQRNAARIGVFALLVSTLVGGFAVRAEAVALSVSPTSDLVDNQVVGVTVAGPFVGSIAIAQCENPVRLDAQNCAYPSVFAGSPADPFINSFVVRQIIHLMDGRTIDCSSSIERCAVGVGDLGAPFAPVSFPIDFQPTLPANIYGVVVDRDGWPVVGAVVSKHPCAEYTCLSTTTDAQGEYRLTGLVPGAAVTIHVAAPSDTYLLNEPPNSWDWPDSFSLESGTSVRRDVLLGHGGRLIVNAERGGEQVDVVWGEACGLESGECFDFLTDELLPPDVYDLVEVVIDENFLLDAEPATVTIVGDVTTAITVHAPAARVSGRVTADGAPIAGAWISASCSSCRGNGAVTDSDGRYEFWVMPGEQRIEVRSPAAYASEPGVMVDPVGGDEATVDFELQRLPTLRISVPGASAINVDICEIEGPYCDSSAFSLGNTIDVVVPHEGNYDVVVDAASISVGTILTDVEVRNGITEIIVPLKSDSDRDGIPDATEVGDRDDDGSLDALQHGVATTSTSDGKSLTVRRRGSNPEPAAFSWALMTAPRDSSVVPPPPSGIEFPHGVMTTRVNHMSTAVLEMVLPDITEALYLQSDTGWERVDGGGLTGATLEGDRATLRLFDGDRHDLDGTFNGRVQINFAPATDGVSGAVITSGPVGFDAEEDASFFVEAPEGATLRCSLDLRAFVPCDATPSYSNVARGPHVLVVQPYLAGKPGTADFRFWYVGAPEGRRASFGPTGVTSSRTAEFTMTGMQNNDTICMLDFAELFECGASVSRTGLAAGPHVLLVFDGTGPHGLSDLRYWLVHRPRSDGV